MQTPRHGGAFAFTSLRFTGETAAATSGASREKQPWTRAQAQSRKLPFSCPSSYSAEAVNKVALIAVSTASKIA